MTQKATEKIIEAITQLLDGYAELQEAVEDDFGGRAETEVDAASEEMTEEMDAAIVTELRAAIESVMESEDYSAAEVGAVISGLTESLEEIDPDVFGTAEADDDDEDDDVDDDDDDDDDIDDDDEDLEEDDDDDDEEEEY